MLEKFTEHQPTESECQMALCEANKSKNRFSTLRLVARDADRPVLSGPLAVSDYINAVYIDSYTQRRAFILTQTPLDSTLDDFLTLLVEQRVR